MGLLKGGKRIKRIPVPTEDPVFITVANTGPQKEGSRVATLTTVALLAKKKKANHNR